MSRRKRHLQATTQIGGQDGFRDRAQRSGQAVFLAPRMKLERSAALKAGDPHLIQAMEEFEELQAQRDAEDAERDAPLALLQTQN